MINYFINRGINYQDSYEEIEIFVSLANDGLLFTIKDTMEDRLEQDIIDFRQVCRDIRYDLNHNLRVKDIKHDYKDNNRINKIYIRCNYDFRN